MKLDLQHGSGRAPVTMEELQVQLSNASIAEWLLIGGERVTITTEGENNLRVAVVNRHGHLGDFLVFDRASFNLNNAIRIAWRKSIRVSEMIDQGEAHLYAPSCRPVTGRQLGHWFSASEPPRPILLVSGATRTIMDLLVGGGLSTAAPYHRLPHLGRLTTPRIRTPPASYAATMLPWAADNDCYKHLRPAAYRRMLDRLALVDLSLFLFVTVPDVVADASATLTRWRTWYPEVERRGLPVAFVAQDSLDLGQVPWDHIQALFIGGSTSWKLGPEAAAACREAKRRGKWLHIGRLNTWPRLCYFEQLEVDSFDGTQFSRFPAKYIPTWLDRLRWRQQGMDLF